MRIPCLRLAKINDEAGWSLLRDTLDATGTFPEPTLDDLHRALDDGDAWTIEAVRVAHGYTVWCDEEFRLKSLTPSAIFINPATGDVWDFGGPLVITKDDGGTMAQLEAFARLALRVPPPGYELAEPSMTFQSFTDEEFEAHRRLIDAEGGQP